MNSSEQNKVNEGKYSNHTKVWQLLPWYINGSLSGAEQQFVALHSNVCLVCHKELGLQRALRESIRTAELDEVMLTSSFDRLSMQIAADAVPGSSAVVGRTSKLVTGIGSWLQQVELAAYATAAALVLALAVVITTFNDSQQPINNTFRTLSNSTPPATTTANLRIIFAEELSTSERAVILSQAGLTAVSGPDARGMYYVKSSSQTLAATEAALTQLRANEQIVFAESALTTAPVNQ